MIHINAVVLLPRQKHPHVDILHREVDGPDEVVVVILKQMYLELVAVRVAILVRDPVLVAG